MSVIIRLQNLPWSANALDIRQYFTGLSIPEGGVHIVGGELGDAFIAFSTDEDARQAFQRNNGKIKSVQITLTLSSRTEMQRVIEAARSQSFSAFMQAAPAATVPMPAAIPPVRPSAIPEVKIDLSKDNKDKRDRERKRSRSRDRRDRSREKDRRRNRDRSRSRSRDRRRRRERSRSRDRSRSRERDRRSRDSSRRRSNEKTLPNPKEQRKIDPWAQNEPPVQQQMVNPNMLAANLANIEELRRNFNVISPNMGGNGFQGNNVQQRGRESWPQTNVPNLKNDYITRTPDDNFNDRMSGNNKMEQMGNDRGNRKNFFEPRNQYDHRVFPNCCVKIEPFYGAYGDLRRFFHGCFISSRGIKFINDKMGTRTGIVFVQFGNPQGKQEAMSRNNENFNGVNLSVVHIDDKEFEQAIDRYVPRHSDDGDDYRQQKQFPNKNRFMNKNEKPEDMLKVFTCLTVEDLPTYVKEQDILKMFSLFPLTSIILPPKGRGNHVAYVQFSNAEDAKKALSATSTHIIEGKPVTVKPCKNEDFERVNEVHEVNISPPNNVKKLDTNCLTISGLPLKTNDRDIADFFSDVGVIPTKIHLMNNNFGFTGQVFCEFETIEEAEKAAGKNSCVLGTQVITVAPIKREEMNRSLGVQDLSGPDNPQSNMDSEEIEHINDMGPLSDMDMHNSMDRQSPGQFQGNNHQRPMFHQRNNFEMNQRGRGFNNSRGGRRSRFGPPVNEQENMGDDIVPPGCTVFMDNIPYKAGTNDILDFFEGYNITNNVSRRFNPNNTPTAEAKVVFHSPQEAFQAVREKHMQTIWDRPIYLRQV